MGDVFAVRSLGDVCVLITDGSHFSPIPRQEGYPIVNAKDMRGGRLDLDSCTRISEKDWKLLCAQNCAPRTGDVLLSKDGTIGRVVFYGDDSGVVLLSSVAIIRPDEATNARYLAQALRSHYFDSQLFKLQSGSALKRLVLSDIRRINLPFPDEARQRKIAAILDTIDQTIEKTEALIEKYQQIKAGLMHDLFTRGIGADGKLRPPREQAPELYQKTPIGWIPKGWCLSELSDEISITHGFAFPGDGFFNYPPGEVLLTPGNFHRGGGLYFTSENTKYFRGYIPPETKLPPGTLVTVMTDLSPQTLILGRFAIVGVDFPVLHNQRIGLVECKKRELWHAPYLVVALNNARIRKEIIVGATGTTVRHTSPGRILDILIARPDMEEQIGAAITLHGAQEKLEKETAFHEKLQQLKQGLMRDLLTGAVQVQAAKPKGARV